MHRTRIRSISSPSSGGLILLCFFLSMSPYFTDNLKKKKKNQVNILIFKNKPYVLEKRGCIR